MTGRKGFSLFMFFDRGDRQLIIRSWTIDHFAKEGHKEKHKERFQCDLDEQVIIGHIEID